ncbi:hypothetical protein MUO98_06725 [Candidatus Bathyarchaeota archaeon]|nr:hypothetical protein [Candidatus Bathyarchaeota archaeon]
MQKEKIVKTLNSALTCLEDAIELHAKGNEEKVMQLTWKASSDLEYALFLFLLEYPQENRKSSRKLSSKQPEIESILISTRDTLKEASKNIDADELNEAQKKTWIAKDQLLRIHDFFEKKGRKNRKLYH